MPPKNSDPLDIMKYRKVVMDKGTFENKFSHGGLWVRINPDMWLCDKKHLPPEEYCTNYKGLSWHNGMGEHRPWRWREKKNHPLVEKGIAFWLDEKTLIAGYYLKHNREVYRPIFQPSKERLNNKLRVEIRYFAKFFVAQKRQALYKNTLMGIPKLSNIPEEIISKIALFTYDPISYLKL